MNAKEAMDGKLPPAADRRQEAERRLRKKKTASAEGMAEVDVRTLLHELRVHQIELEMQSEELERARATAEEASEKYHDLFDFAPVGYFLWDVQGRILEVNLAGAALLGLDRNMLVQKRFGQFVAVEHRAAFADFCHRALLVDAKQTCEVTILKDAQAVAALVEGIAVQDRQGERKVCRAAVIDISHLLTIAEDIQRGIAQDLHDDVGQELTGLGLKAVTLAEMLAPATTPVGKLAATIAAAIDRTYDKVRGLCRGMMPIELEEGLLAGALAQLVAATSGSSRVRCEFACSHLDPVLDRTISLQLYRIAQEAVTNALRHSRAHNIRIALACENGDSVLSIEDNGTGLSSAAAQAEGMGLRAMRYRAALIGAQLEVGPRRGGGTRIVCRLVAPPANVEIEK